jgi:hypothetical protein
VLSVNSAKAAVDPFQAGLAGLRPDALWADLNTASPGTKRQLADIAAGRALHERLARNPAAPASPTPASPTSES